MKHLRDVASTTRTATLAQSMISIGDDSATDAPHFNSPPGFVRMATGTPAYEDAQTCRGLAKSVASQGRLEMGQTQLRHRLASHSDLADLKSLMDAAISENQKPFLSTEQISSSRAVMGLDSQLIEDGTYFVIEIDGALAGCGGWSRRATLYGGDSTSGRDAALLDPAKDAARIRAMYTHPDFTRRGVGRLIMVLCEEVARNEGFREIELMATLSGEPLYLACGYRPIERVEDARGGASVPLIRMRKPLEA